MKGSIYGIDFEFKEIQDGLLEARMVFPKEVSQEMLFSPNDEEFIKKLYEELSFFLKCLPYLISITTYPITEGRGERG